MPKKAEAIEPAGMNREAMGEAISAAKDAKEVDALWAAWEKTGHSKEGLLHAECLAKKKALGAKLSEGDIERIEKAEAAKARGAILPKIGVKAGG